MSRQLEDADDAQNAKHLDHFSDGAQMFEVTSRGHFDDCQMHVEGKYGDQIDGVQGIFEKPASIGTGPQANEVFQSEPGYTNELDDFEILIFVNSIRDVGLWFKGNIGAFCDVDYQWGSTSQPAAF